MSRWVIGILLGCLIGLTDLSSADTIKSDNVLSRTIPVLTISGAIGPAVGDYVINEIQRANRRSNVPAIIITIDTPGGLVSSLRDINQQILASNIPVLCLVYPQGARAASAGTYILYACHIAAMAPATTLGAATPVQIGGMPGGGSPEGEEENHGPSAMEKKILNDSIAYIRSLAQLRGRNAEWAEKAVREAATLSASEALDNNVINLIADTPDVLAERLHSQTVVVNKQPQEMDLQGAALEPRTPDWRNKFLATITDPNIAYILMMIGVYGLLLEFYSPGFGIAGTIGAISLLVALYAFQLLPVNYVGLGLILVGIALLIAEAMVPSFGLLGVGGIIAFTLGSVFLIDTDLPELKISMSLIYAIAIVSGGFIVLVLKTLWNFRHKQVVSGADALIGCEAEADNNFTEHGFVLIRGERWAARCDEPLRKGDVVVVDTVDGLTLQVRKRTGSEEK
ncbi:serine protease [Vibrio albus]|uniref:Serine protease n=1 Tax=Vibrio albus TaxID=2200953 RepID=A0A2U3B942_9VIBR|nr:nodulation protein NfeD [Vibrio albus]PWI33265.1 serine protease [Vibrio albus]